MTAGDVVDRIKKQLGCRGADTYRDTFIRRTHRSGASRRRCSVRTRAFASKRRGLQYDIR